MSGLKNVVKNCKNRLLCQIYWFYRLLKILYILNTSLDSWRFYIKEWFQGGKKRPKVYDCHLAEKVPSEENN